MAKGYSLHIGVNEVDPIFYNGKRGFLNCSELDAKEMAKIAKDLGYIETHLLLTKQATIVAFNTLVQEIKEKLEPGDLFFISFSGHGKQVLDPTNDLFNGYASAWCFYDGLLTSHGINRLLKIFPEKVQIVIVSDSCYSGGILGPWSDSSYQPSKNIVHIDSEWTAATIHLLACSEHNQRSKSGIPNSYFTKILLDVWQDVSFSSTYTEFLKKISDKSTSGPSPCYVRINGDDNDIHKSKPFLVSGWQSNFFLDFIPPTTQQGNKSIYLNLEIKLNRNQDSFTEKDALNFIEGFRDFSQLDHPIRLIKVEKVSAILDLEIQYIDGIKAIASFLEGRYSRFGIKGIRLKSFINTKSPKHSRDIGGIKNKFRDDIMKDVGAAFKNLRNSLDENSPIYDDFALLLNRFHRNDRKYKSGEITYDQFESTLTKLTNSLLQLVKSLEKGDLKSDK